MIQVDLSMDRLIALKDDYTIVNRIPGETVQRYLERWSMAYLKEKPITTPIQGVGEESYTYNPQFTYQRKYMDGIAFEFKTVRNAALFKLKWYPRGI